jgi:uncharacterized protein
MNMIIRTIILAKAPHSGKVKTRLVPSIGVAAAADLAVKLLVDTVARAMGAELGPVELCLAPLADRCWQQIDLPTGLHYSDQGPGDLGGRMARVSNRAIAQGERVILLGTDCPALSVTELQAIAMALSKQDAVVVPALDGGYVALGLSRFDPMLFAGIAWGSSLVLAQTLKRLQALAWRFELRDPLPDIDEPADLQYLPGAWQAWLNSQVK